METFASCDTNPRLRGAVPRRVKAVPRVSVPSAGAEIFGAEGFRQARWRRKRRVKAAATAAPKRRVIRLRDDWRRRALQERRWKLSLASANVIVS